MRSLTYLGVALGLTLFGAPSAWAHDYWDLASTTDDGPQVVNEVVHGASQQHDLETKAGPLADEDWFFVVSYAASSYEAVVDATSGDLALFITSANFQRLDVTGTTVIQMSEQANVGAPFAGASVALRWQNTGPLVEQWLVVRSATCGLTCGAEDQYHIRFYDTTVAVPRFNNASGQITVLIVQNAASTTAGGTAHFWNAAGSGVGGHSFVVPEGGVLVLNTTTVPGAAGISGTITISHNARYGDLAVKSVALEPATGFSFDTPGLYRPF